MKVTNKKRHLFRDLLWICLKYYFFFYFVLGVFQKECRIFAQTRSEPSKTKQASTDLSPKLKANLLRAKQIRNLLKFDGFVKLAVPDEIHFEKISDVATLGDNYFVFDEKNALALKFDRQGRYQRTISRRGSGPGECQKPFAIGRAYEDHLYLADVHGLLVFDKTGQFVHRIDGFQEMRAWVGSSAVIWETPNQLFISNPFPKSPDRLQHGLVTLEKSRVSQILDFGNTSLGEISKSPNGHSLAWTSFAKVGEQVWVGSPYVAVLERYDSQGTYIGPVPASDHPEGVTREDFENLNRNELHKLLFDWKNPKLLNKSLHPIGPIVLRTLSSTAGFYLYDVFDQRGNLLAKALTGGASSIEILDTHGEQLVGKVQAFDHLELNAETLKKTLYRPEYDALMEAGFTFESEDDGLYLWLAHLP